MCGRYTLKTAPEIVAEQFQLEQPLAIQPRYNVAPSQLVACIRTNPASIEREGVFLWWGLIPSWAKDPKIGMQLINARAETLAEKPSFRAAFRHRRCLVLADGFYEWRREGRTKQPYFFRFREGGPFAMCGLWERWEKSDGSPIESCAIVTTESNAVLEPIHNRMPVILNPKDYDLWLDPRRKDPAELSCLLQPYPPDEMVAVPVSLRVNNPKNDDPKCLERVEVSGS